jgi:hypothetical protein
LTIRQKFFFLSSSKSGVINKDTGDGIPALEGDSHGFVTGLEILSDEFFDLFVGHENDLVIKKPSP